jgi:hypothetical protein
MVIYKNIAVPLRTKSWHIHKIGKKLHRGFTEEFGDIPVCRFNIQTGKIEDVWNPRGRAYAARKRCMYRKKIKIIEINRLVVFTFDCNSWLQSL